VTSHGAHDVTVHLLAACPNRSCLEAHGFGLDRYIEHPLILEQGMAISPMRQARQKLRLERSWSVLRLKRCGGQCEASNSLEIRSLEQAQIGGGDRVQADSVKQPERRLVVAAVRRKVRCWVNNGKHMFALSFSAFDPNRKSSLPVDQPICRSLERFSYASERCDAVSRPQLLQKFAATSS
jgi:hypothetical protein